MAQELAVQHMVQESISDHGVDDFYFSALSSENESENGQIFPISDAKYAEELQFQETLMASVITSSNNLMVSVITSQTSNNASASASSSLAIRENPELNPEPTEICVETKGIGESSHGFCEICVERKESEEMFRMENCSHSFCSDCISKHVAVKIQDNIHMVTCPDLDCKGVLEPDSCSSMIAKDVLVRWDEVFCESLIPASQKFYCPFRDCSAMLVNDTFEVIRESECPICRRLFCAQCNVPWHPGIECEEFRILNEDERGRQDLMVRELAKEKNWSRCPQCKFYVERTEGCPHMTCRCGFQFCYGCGATWSSSHGGCQRP